MKLHYSQTGISILYVVHRFDYHMKLHYSQTLEEPEVIPEAV